MCETKRNKTEVRNTQIQKKSMCLKRKTTEGHKNMFPMANCDLMN